MEGLQLIDVTRLSSLCKCRLLGILRLKRQKRFTGRVSRLVYSSFLVPLAALKERGSINIIDRVFYKDDR